jgi:acetyl esterase/lipase
MSIQLMMVKKQMKKFGATFASDHFDVEVLREGAKASAQMPPVKGVTYEEKVYDGITVDVAAPKKETSGNLIIYIHGGGMVSGDPRYVRSFTSYLANAYGGKVYGVVYGLSPEYKFPEPVEHSVTAIKAIRRENPGAKITLVGESAGAYHVVACTLMLKAQGEVLPDAVVAFAPLIDVSGVLDRSAYPDDMVVDYRALPAMISCFCREDQDLTDPICSPYYADFTGFPPLRVVWDSSECLSVDCRELVKKAKTAGVTVESKEWSGTFHTFEMLAAILPEGKKEIAETLAFIRKYTEA